MVTRSDDELPAPEIVVLADLGVDPSAGSSRAEIGQVLRVERGGLAAALREVRSILSITLPGADDPDRSGQIPVRSANSLDPGDLAERVPITARLVELRRALVALKAPLGSVRDLRLRFAQVIGDAPQRWALRARLGLPEGAGIGAADLVIAARTPLVAGVLERLSSPGEAHVERLVQACIDCRVVGDGREGIDLCRLGVRALLLQLLHPSWIEVPVTAAVPRDMIEILDEVISPLLDDIVRHPAVRAAERAVRGLDRLAATHAFTLVHCPRAALIDPPPELITAARRGFPRVICAPHHLDPRRDAGALAAWARVAASVDAVFVADAPIDLAGTIEGPIPDAWGALTTPELAGRIALCPQRLLLRLTYGSHTLPVRALDYTEAFSGDEEELLWGSVALFLAPWIASRAASRRPVAGFDRILSGEDVYLREQLIGHRVLTRPLVSPAPPRGQSARRIALGLVDVHCRTGEDPPSIYVPRAALEQRPDGRFADAWPIPDLPDAAFTTGDEQRRPFHPDGMKRCLRCGGAVREDLEPAGCRMNGDGHGVAYFRCPCGWATAFHYDEGNDEDTPYYFETRFW